MFFASSDVIRTTLKVAICNSFATPFAQCEVELAWLDMSINFSKSSCLRIGPRNDVVCATTTSSTDHSIYDGLLRSDI